MAEHSSDGMKPVMERARALRKLKLRKTAAAKLEKELGAEIKEKAAELARIFDGIGMQNMKFVDDDGVKVTAYRCTLNSTSVTNREVFLVWCGANDIDHEMLMMWSWQKIQGWYKERRESSLSLPTGMTTFTEDSVGMRKA